MSTGVIDRFMDIVEASELTKPQEKFVTVILSLPALMEPTEREQALRAIEESGALLQVAQRFSGARRTPEVPLLHETRRRWSVVSCFVSGLCPKMPPHAPKDAPLSGQTGHAGIAGMT